MTKRKDQIIMKWCSFNYRILFAVHFVVVRFIYTTTYLFAELLISCCVCARVDVERTR